MASSSSMKAINSEIPQYQVFINFRGKEVRHSFISYLFGRLKENGINAYLDSIEEKGQPLQILLQRIEESRIALVIFSQKYTESIWCLMELAKIKERFDEKKLKVIPIFYKIEIGTVKKQLGIFGDKFRDLVENVDEQTKEEWTEALKCIANLISFKVTEKSNQNNLVNEIFKAVTKALNNLSEDSQSNIKNVELSSSTLIKEKTPESLCGINLRLKQLKEHLSLDSDKTCVLGVVGMPGIGKTTLTSKLYNNSKDRFLSHSQILDIQEISKQDGSNYLPIILLEDLLKLKNPKFESVKAAHKPYKDELLKTKVLIVLDNVTNKEQIDVLLGERDWIRQGSKIIIATNDKTLLDGLVDYIYEVPRLTDRDGLSHFNHYAFANTQQQQQQQEQQKQHFSMFSKRFVHYARGNPLALMILGVELQGKDKSHWESKLAAFTQHCNGPLGESSRNMLQRVWEDSYDGLNQKQKDMLLDIACFKSMDESYLTSILDSTDAKKGILDLVNKFMISITSSGQVEMHETLYDFSKQRGIDENPPCRLWDHQSIIDILENNKGASGVRSILLDLSDLKTVKSLHSRVFYWMKKMKYLKIYSSKCPQECERDIILNFPDGLELPLNELRCLHLLKFPLKELPQDFNPDNLVDLKLTYTMIERVWEGDKYASKLKWINLNHSRKLNTLSGLTEARNVQELNLEGCTSLKTLPLDIQNMELLVFLNLRGCTSLEALPDISLISLQTLILSNCSNLKKFQVISEKLETLYLNGTSIKKLPYDINKLQKLILLNMKDCKKLKTLPDSFGDLVSLRELILSGCSKVKKLPKIGEENMKCLEILLLDDTSIEEIPLITSLRRLGLSRNENIISLPDFITQLTKLQWLDLKFCIKLTCLPKLPSSLQWLDASNCFSLKKVAEPLIVTSTEFSMDQTNSMFIFANCFELEQAAKEEIATYAERKCQLISKALKHLNEGFLWEILFSTCYPGYEIPSWFSYETIGSLMEFELLPHWNYTKLSGIAICVVVSVKNHHQNHANLSVKFTCYESSTSMIWKISGMIEQCNEVETVKSDHVFIGYINNCLDFVKLLQGQHPRSKCSPTKATLKFSFKSEEDNVVQVLKSGLSFVFESDDKKKNQYQEVNRNDNINGVTKHQKENEKVLIKVMKDATVMPSELEDFCPKTYEKKDNSFEIILKM